MYMGMASILVMIGQAVSKKKMIGILQDAVRRNMGILLAHL